MREAVGHRVNRTASGGGGCGGGCGGCGGGGWGWLCAAVFSGLSSPLHISFPLSSRVSAKQA